MGKFDLAIECLKEWGNIMEVDYSSAIAALEDLERIEPEHKRHLLVMLEALKNQRRGVPRVALNILLDLVEAIPETRE